MGKIANLLAVFAVIFTVALMVPSISKAGDLEIGGYVSIAAEGSTDSHHGPDTFSVEEVEINFTKELADGISVTVDTQFAGDANVFGGGGMVVDENGDAIIVCCPSLARTESGVGFGIEQAFVTLPAGPVALQVGLFNLPIGLEGADKTDITTASHSMTFNNLVPTSGAGVMASFAPEGAPVNVDLYVINGWDSPADNNSAKTMGGRIGFDIGEMANIGVSYITGREFAGEGNPQTAAAVLSLALGNSAAGLSDYNDSETTVMDIDITITPIEALTLGIEINEGEQTEIGIMDASGNTTDGEWSAITLSANYKFNETCGLTVRLEELEDTDGNVFGVQSKKSYANGLSNDDEGATWETVTVALSHHIADGAELILEYSTVEADVHKDQGIFHVGGKNDTSAEMYTAEFVYSF